MATQTLPSASVLAKKAALLEMQGEWRTVRDKATGERSIRMPNLTGTHVYKVHPQGKACSCKAGQHGILCAHRLAAIERANHEALATWTSEVAAPSVAASTKKDYRGVFGFCAAKGCQEDAARGEDYCERHVLVDAF